MRQGDEAKIRFGSGVVAVLTVGAARLVYENFYRAIGTSVDEVGLSTWHMLAVAVAVLLSIAPAAAVACAIGAAIDVLVWSNTTALGRLGTACLGLLGGLVSLIAVLRLEQWSDKTVELPLSLALGGVLLLAATSGLACGRGRILATAVPWFVAVNVLVAAGFWAFAWVQAGDAALSLRPDGTRRKDATVLLDIDARPRCLKTVDPQPAGLSTVKPLLLLGEDGAHVVVRDVRKKRTFVLPAGAAALSTPDNGHC